MALGFYTAVESDYSESTLLIIGISLAFLMYFVVNLPFSNVYQNYRGAFVHFTMMYTLLTANYYRTMKSTTPVEIKGKIYTPALIELALIALTIAFSLMVLIYEVYQIFRNCNK
jgi:hypothetical protein